MKIHQLSLFLENRPGQLAGPCRTLGDAGIDIVAVSLADTEQFGILRLIVGDWGRAKQVLESAGFVVKLTEVVAVEADCGPAGVASTLELIEAAGLNVEYMYAFPRQHRSRGVLVFRFEDTASAIAALADRGVRMLESEALVPGESDGAGPSGVGSA